MLRCKKESIVSRINAAFIESKLLFQNQSFISKWLFQFKFETSFLKLKSPFWIRSFCLGINASFPTYYKIHIRSFVSNLLLQIRLEASFPEPKRFYQNQSFSFPETCCRFRKQNFNSGNELQIWVVITSWKWSFEFEFF